MLMADEGARTMMGPVSCPTSTAKHAAPVFTATFAAAPTAGHRRGPSMSGEAGSPGPHVVRCARTSSSRCAPPCTAPGPVRSTGCPVSERRRPISPSNCTHPPSGAPPVPSRSVAVSSCRCLAGRCRHRRGAASPRASRVPRASRLPRAGCPVPVPVMWPFEGSMLASAAAGSASSTGPAGSSVRP